LAHLRLLLLRQLGSGRTASRTAPFFPLDLILSECRRNDRCGKQNEAKAPHAPFFYHGEDGMQNETGWRG